MYVLKGGEEEVPEVLRCCCAGGAVTDLLDCEDVGVRGREEVPGMLLLSRLAFAALQSTRVKAHKVSNFNMSAWEYAAPTTRLDSRVGFMGGPLACGALRQKGGAELPGRQRWSVARERASGTDILRPV